MVDYLHDSICLLLNFQFPAITISLVLFSFVTILFCYASVAVLPELHFSPECDVVLFPLQSLDGVAFSPQVGLQLGSELIWDATARPLHRPGNHIAMVRSCTVEGD